MKKPIIFIFIIFGATSLFAGKTDKNHGLKGEHEKECCVKNNDKVNKLTSEGVKSNTDIDLETSSRGFADEDLYSHIHQFASCSTVRIDKVNNVEVIGELILVNNDIIIQTPSEIEFKTTLAYLEAAMENNSGASAFATYSDDNGTYFWYDCSIEQFFHS